MATATFTAKNDRPSPGPKGFLFAVAILSVLVPAGVAIPAALAPINVSATILSNSNCKFNTGAAALPFGILDPANPVVVNVSTSFDFRCMGAAGLAVFIISQDGGLNPLGPQNQMEHVGIPGQFLPYSLSLVHVAPPIPKNAWQILTIDGTVLGADYQNVPAGDYLDTVVISIIP